jgi:membrane protease YdiL (CAAX protease family)
MLAHLGKMINAAPVFPIVNDGSAPMMPIHAGDVAAGVVAALARPASAGKTYDLVSPDRMTLRDVVRRTATALGRAVWIVPTPVGLMRLPVRIMEAAMKQPLSTRAQLAMVAEGLPGDPGPARAELGVEAAPFTPEKIRPMVRRIPKEVSAPVALGLYAAAAALLTFAFRGPLGPWNGMTVAMGLLLAASLAVRAVRARLVPTFGRVALGLGAGAVLYGLTRVALVVFDAAWPGWTVQAGRISAWKEGHSTGFLLASLVMIVIAEEALWRGVVSRFMVERLGRVFGIVAGATLYAAAHVATMSPLLAIAAFACGIYWGLLADASDDLTAPIVSHLAWDIMIMFVVPVV